MFRDLRTQILLWTILPLVALLIAVAYLGVNSHQTAMRDMVEERDSALARVTAARMSEALASRQAILQALVPANPSIWHSERTAFDGGIAEFDLQGSIVYAEPSVQIWEPQRSTVSSLLVAKRSFSEPFLENGATCVIVLVPGGTGVLAGAFTLPPLANAGTGPNAVAYLVDAQGTTVIDVPAQPSGSELRYSCSMGMYTGKIVFR